MLSKQQNIKVAFMLSKLSEVLRVLYSSLTWLSQEQMNGIEATVEQYHILVPTAGNVWPSLLIQHALIFHLSSQSSL